MLKFKLPKKDYEALSDAEKAHYKVDEGNDDQYVLDIEGAPDNDVSALKRAKEHEKEARKAAEQRFKDLESQFNDLQAKLDENKDKQSRENGDVKALEASWKQKLERRENELTEQMQKVQGQLQKVTLDRAAQEIATKLNPEATKVLYPHVRSRLQGVEDPETGDFVVKVLDENGKPSANSLEDLQQEFLASNDFARIVVGSKASGSGAQGARSGGAARKKLSEMSATEEARFANEHPEDYQRELEQMQSQS